MSQTAIDKIRALEDERSALVDAARSEALEQVNAGIELLQELGYDSALVEEKKPKPRQSRKGSRKPKAGQPCPICKFETDPPHDARHHRNQAVKAPFTDAELAERGWRKVEPVKAESENDLSTWNFETSSAA